MRLMRGNGLMGNLMVMGFTPGDWKPSVIINIHATTFIEDVGIEECAMGWVLFSILMAPNMRDTGREISRYNFFLIAARKW